MRSLVLLIIINIIFIITILGNVKAPEYNYLFNFSIILIIAAILFLKNIEAAVLLTASTLFLISFIVLGVPLAAVAQAFIFLAAGSACAFYLKRLTMRMLALNENKFNSINDEYQLYIDMNQKADAEKRYLEKAVYDISSLYQAPKRMAASATLEDLLNCLKESLSTYFSFKSCELIIFSFKDKEPKVDKVYSIPEVKDITTRTNNYEESLLKIFSGKKSPIVVDKSTKMEPPAGLPIPEDIETFIAAPLISGDRINGIFVIEEAPLNDMLRIIILAHQFAMALERIRLYELVQELAITDGLTEAFVRRHFLERFNEEIERAGYFNTSLSVMMIDIDDFKKCNDKYGHLVGDVVLKNIAQILKKNLRDIDIMGRYGGEEFSIMLPETTKKDALVAGERLRSAIENSIIAAYDESIKSTVSIGIATFPDDTKELSQLIDKSDQMLYKAKNNGRNRVEVYQ